MRVCVVPAFRASTSIVRVISSVLPHVDRIVVVDDACPDETGSVAATAFARDSRVEVVYALINRGVGGAMKVGVAKALAVGATLIVKVDADDQMDAGFISDMFRILEENPRIALVKGNRFTNRSLLRIMPTTRLIGNSALTLCVRMATGYWNSVDPTNGFLAFRATALRRIDLNRLSDRYYFEISILAAFGMRRTEIAEIEMPAIYGSIPSNLSIAKAIVTFPIRLAASFVKRLAWQYLVADMNVGSLLLILGLILSTFAAIAGSILWVHALQSGVPTTAGTATIVIAPLIMGFQLLLNALLYDVQFSSRVYKFSRDDATLSENVYAIVRA